MIGSPRDCERTGVSELKSRPGHEAAWHRGSGVNARTMNRYHNLGDTGLACHPLGFGSYRISQGNREHESALRAYLERGGNLIDTSANYADGDSEILIGHVLRDHPREKIIVVTKGGYIQGRNMELAQRRQFPEVVYFGEGIWHCIHPEFIETQIQRSLERMRLQHIDIYLLHNPEYYLTEKEYHGGPTPQDHEEFYRRIREAFRFLESQVDSGAIRWYGISSNNYVLPHPDPTMTSVSRCLEEARRIKREHHFRIIQLPMNLYESGGALEPNNAGKTALEFCRQERLGVLINRPLNAFFNNRMIRLAEFVKPGQRPPDAEALKSMLKPLRDHEQRLTVELGIPPVAAEKGGLAAVLEELIPRLKFPSDWESAAGAYVIRPMQIWLREQKQALAGDARLEAWQRDFLEVIHTLFEEVGRFMSFKRQTVSDTVRTRLYEAGYPETDQTLSRMAMNVLAHLSGVDCILNGMRRAPYVDDAMGVPDLPPVDGLRILRNFRREIA
jgi:aryl-alcohol dehydrogenase-like predicted oxidoreductase